MYNFLVRPIGWIPTSQPISTDVFADILLVGGGGGGGSGKEGLYEGIGGAGGGVTEFSYFKLNSMHYITVGKGGNPSPVSVIGENGGWSAVDNQLIALGGAGGSSEANNTVGLFACGAGTRKITGNMPISYGFPPQGFNGGKSTSTAWAGGSGGAGGAGADYDGINTVAQEGIGKTVSITGTPIAYGAAGKNGGNITALSGINGLGSGGYGGTSVNNTVGQRGGDGIVILRYKTAYMQATGGTITYDGEYTIHTFTESGTFTVN